MTTNYGAGLLLVLLLVSHCGDFQVVQEYERAVIFRLGRLLPGGAKGPGIIMTDSGARL